MNVRRWIQGSSEGSRAACAAESSKVETFVLYERSCVLGRSIACGAQLRGPVRVLHDVADLMEDVESSRGRGREVVLVVCDRGRSPLARLVPVAWFARITSLASSFVYIDAEAVRVFRNGALLLDRPVGGLSGAGVAALVDRVVRRLAEGVSNSSGLAPVGTRVSSARRSSSALARLDAGFESAGRVA